MDVTPSLLAPLPVSTDEGGAVGVVIRPLASLADFGACVALQREIWGDVFEVVPAAILQVSTHIGGIAAGAFDASGRLVGFVFGLTGIEDDRLVHWSHMLGVGPALRNAHLGRLLKEYQRRELERRHIGEMHWTYDPLIAKNAHFNLNVLGARVLRFVPDMYGDSGSPLHHGLATDRLVVSLHAADAPRHAALALGARDARAPVLTAHPQPGDPSLPPDGTLAPRLRLEIPSDFAQLLLESPADARAWHAATREHFQWALARHYAVTGFRRDPSTARSFYMLERLPPAAPPPT